jgi:hypothetical protein
MQYMGFIYVELWVHVADSYKFRLWLLIHWATILICILVWRCFYPSWSWVLCMFAKLQRATISFAVSVHLSICMKQLSTNRTDFHRIWYLSIFRKSAEKIQVSLKSKKNNRYFTISPVYVYDSILLSASWSGEMLRTKFVEKIAHILCSVPFYRKLYWLWDNIEKYGIAIQASR